MPTTLEKGDEKERIKAKIIEALKNVYDPEIPVNVVDLGLIYNVEVDDQKNVKIKMTLTAPGCPVSGLIVLQAEEIIKENVPEAKNIDIELVWDPPWTPDRITKEGRELLKAMFGYDVVEEWKKRLRGE